MEFILSHLIDFIDQYYHQKIILKRLKELKLEIIFDIGAHKGEFSKSILNIKTTKKIYAFEPQKKIFNEYSKILNKNQKIKYINFALSDVSGKRRIQINKKTSTSTFSKININSNWFKIKNLLLGGYNRSSFLKNEYVKTSTGDKFIKLFKLKYIDLLKIDTEGHEYFVLKGFKKSFKKNSIKSILIEIHNNEMFKQYNIKTIENFLKKNNFIFKEKFKFPFLTFEDRLYINNKY
jgi:FkbM family methyltransferase